MHISPRSIMRFFKRTFACNEEIANAYYGIACIYSLHGNKKLALQFLEKSIQSGFYDLDRIERDRDLKTIKGDGGWKKLKVRYY